MDKSRFIICKAAAGSGKTFTLVKTFLTLSFSVKNEKQLKSRFSRILAITFTNKAANEMKERIMAKLESISQLGQADDMGKLIGQELELDNEKLKRYASTVKSAILHNYSDLSVCTIDSFMHRIVRTFAHDLNIPINFEVYIDNSDLIQNAVDELMSLAGSDDNEALTRTLCDFADMKMGEGLSYAIENDIAKLAEEIFKENVPTFLDQLKDYDTDRFRSISRQMIQDNKDYEEALSIRAKKIIDLYQSAGIQPTDFPRSGVSKYLDYLAQKDLLDSKKKLRKPNSYVADFVDGTVLYTQSLAQDRKDLMAAHYPQLRDALTELSDFRKRGDQLYDTRRMLRKNIYSLAVLNKLNEIVNQFSHENEILHISEFNKRISEVVQTEPAPFVYERIGSRYWNYLIDEFQDTSRMQWLNLVPLVENGVSSGHTSLVVGDGKQAIYRFRQGDVEQFVNLPQIDSDMHGQMLAAPGIAQNNTLERNFRSEPEIVNFNNRFFEWIIKNRFSDNQELQDIYIGSDPDHPELAQKAKAGKGFVQIGFHKLDNDLDILWGKMLEDIRLLIDEQGYSYRDITLLARDNKQLGIISEYLTAHNVPVVSSESFLLTQSRVVMMLKALLRYLLNENDTIAMAKVLMYLQMLGKTQGIESNDFIDSPQPNLEDILHRQGLELDCNKLRNLDLYNCCEEALRMFHLQGIETAYTATLLNVISKYSNTHRQDLAEFLEWFDKKLEKLSTSTANDLDAVRLMTIHKSKGLESPIIMYPILCKKAHQSKIWVNIDDKDIPLSTSLISQNAEADTLFNDECKAEAQKNDMDSVNILYVALTRPEEKLLIYCEDPEKEKKEPKKKSSSKKEADPTPKTDYPSLLLDCLTSWDTEDSHRQGEEKLWHFGQNTPKEQKEAKENKILNVKADEIVFPTWTDRISIALQSSLKSLESEAVQRGLQMHEVLAMIKNINDLDSAVNAYASRQHLDEESKLQLLNDVTRVVTDSDCAHFFSPSYECKNECSLTFNGETLRPDRIVMAPDTTWVVDFKTGAPELAHHAQVEHYCRAIEAMGYPQVKGYLIYIGTSGCQVTECKA